jgi:hypothetical protein
MKLKFSRQSSKNSQISILIKILSAGAEFLHSAGKTEERTDRLTEMTKLIVAFCNFANATKTVNLSQI